MSLKSLILVIKLLVLILLVGTLGISITEALPDIEPQYLLKQGPSVVYINNQLTFSFKINNTGDQATSRFDWLLDGGNSNTSTGSIANILPNSAGSPTLRNIKYIDDGEYTAILAADHTNNCTEDDESNNNASLNVKVYFNPPNTTLSYPLNDSTYSISDIIQFNFSVMFRKSHGINNCSLYGNWSGTWELNQTNSSAISNNTIYNFDPIHLPPGNHSWNIVCYDNGSVSLPAWGNASTPGKGNIGFNFTINIMQNTKVNLNAPSDNSIRLNTDSILFNFTVEYGPSYGIGNCSLWGNFTGTWEVNQTFYKYCYQENPNQTTVTDGSCTLNYTGDYAHAVRYLYVNYSKPIDAIGAKWQVKHGNENPYNVTIPSDCWDYNPSLIILRLYSSAKHPGGDWSSSSWGECYNGTVWSTNITLNESFTEGGSYSAYTAQAIDTNWATHGHYSADHGIWNIYTGIEGATIYEESIWWNVSYISNNTITNFKNPLTFPIGTYIWNIKCYDNASSASSFLGYSNFTLQINKNKFPKFSSAKNTSLNYRYLNTTMNITISEDTALSGYIFSWNITGSWVNESWVDIPDDTKASINISRNITAYPGKTIAWRYHANDTADSWNSSNTYAIRVANRLPSLASNYTIGTLTYGNTISFNASINYDNDADRFNMTLNVSMPNGTLIKNNVVGTNASKWYNFTWTNIILDYPYSGAYTWDLFYWDNSSNPKQNATSSGSFEIRRNTTTFISFNQTKPNLNVYHMNYWTNKIFILNLTTTDYNLSWAILNITFPDGGVNKSEGKREEGLNYSARNVVMSFNWTGIYQNGTYLFNYTYRTFSGNQSTPVEFNHTITHVTSFLPKAYYFSPLIYVNETLTSSLQLWSNTNTSFEYNISIDLQNASWFNITIRTKDRNWNATNLTKRVNSSTALKIPFTIKAYNNSIPNGEYYGNLTINRTRDANNWVIPITIGINPPAGNISIYDSTAVYHCNSSTISSCYGNLQGQIYGSPITKSWIINNTGSYPLSDCIPTLTDSMPLGLIKWRRTDQTNYIGSFGVATGGSFALTLEIPQTSVPGTWNNNYLNITCKATARGYTTSADSGNMPKIDIVIETAATSASGGAGGGGAGGEAEALPVAKVAPTRELRVFGDGICDAGEDPNSPDCKVTFNFDSLVTCVWDPDIPCIYGESWFIQLLIYFVVAIGLYTIRGAPKKTRKSFSSFFSEQLEEEDKK